jgi:hypothetical protein
VDSRREVLSPRGERRALKYFQGMCAVDSDVVCVCLWCVCVCVRERECVCVRGSVCVSEGVTKTGNVVSVCRRVPGGGGGLSWFP